MKIFFFDISTRIRKYNPTFSQVKSIPIETDSHGRRPVPSCSIGMHSDD